MASLVRRLVDCLSFGAVSDLGAAVGLQFHRDIPRKRQVCLSYGKRFGREGAPRAAIERLAPDEIMRAIEKRRYGISREEATEWLDREYRPVELQSLPAGKLRRLAGDVFSAESDEDLEEVLTNAWGRHFELVHEERSPMDESREECREVEHRPDVERESAEEGHGFDQDEESDLGSERRVRDREKFLEHLRRAEEREVRGTLWHLPEIADADLQPLLKHQARALERIAANHYGSGIVHLPTGAGKTRVALEVMEHWLRDPGARVVWATHSKTLIRQSLIRLIELLERFRGPISILWLGDRDQAVEPDLFERAQVVFATRDTLTKWFDAAADRRRRDEPLRRALAGRAGSRAARRILLVYDECHEIGARGLQRAWGKLVDSVGERGLERLSVLGLSATPMPTGVRAQAFLQDVLFPKREGTKTAKPDWNVLVHHSESMQELTEARILCPMNLTFQNSGHFDIPAELVRRITAETLPPSPSPGTDLARKELEDFSRSFNRAVMSHEEVLAHLAARIAEELEELGKTLVFCATIDAADLLVDLLRREPRVGEGKVTLVHSRMEDPEPVELEPGAPRDHTRKELQIHEFLDRGSQPCVMANVGMLTTGFDDPKIRSIVLARLTFSKNLFWQMIGRGLRGPFANGTPDCYVIDPIRLTDRFEVYNGYRPTVLARGIPEERDIGHDELPPLTHEKERPPRSDTQMDPAIRLGVQEALRAFLRGEPFAIDEVETALREVRVESRPGGSVIMPSEGESPKSSQLAILEGGIRALETSLGSDFSWLYGEIPTLLTEAARKWFLRVVEIVREKGIRTHEELYEYRRSRL